MITRTLQKFKVYVTRRHDEHTVIYDDAYTTLAEYVSFLTRNGGIYDSEGNGWIPFHRINYIAREKGQ